MADVMVGSARIDENGNATGGEAGSQSSKEVSTQKWYLHSKGWDVLRFKDPSAAQKAAEAMQAACDSKYVGYDQHQRDTLLKAAKPLGYDISKVTTPCECDCSSLIRVCLAYAVGRDVVAETTSDRFSTRNLVDVLLKTGLFVQLTGAEYTDSKDRLGVGDILNTRTQGHVVMVLNEGDKYDGKTQIAPDPNMLTVKGYRWNVRTGPGTDYDSVGKLDDGDQVRRVDTTDWIPVIYKGEVCFMHKDAFVRVDN